MTEPGETSVLSCSSSAEHAGRWLCLGGAALGALGLIGWIAEVDLLITMVPGEPPMMPSTAFGLLLIGGAGAMRCRQDDDRVRKVVSLAAALTVLVIGVEALAAYAFPVDLHIHIDEVVVPAESGRPSPLAALALTFLATALLTFDCRPTARARPSEWLILFAGLMAFTALVGFIFGAALLHPFLTRAPLMSVALPTALSVLLISTGLLLERSRGGLMSVAVSSGPGGVLLRRLILPAILVPLVLGLIGAQLLRTLDLVELSVAGAVMTSTMVIVVLFLLTVTAVPLNRAHQALEASRTRTRNLVEQAPDGVFVADLTGRYTDVNTAGCRMLGYSREEIIGKTIMDLIPPEEVERLAQSKEVMLKGASDIDEYRLRRKDGRYLPVEVSAGILPDGQWQGLVRDISERKRLEAALQRSYADLKRAQALGSIGSWRLDVRTNLLEWSEETYRIFGVPIGTNLTYEVFLACVHPEDRAYVDRVWTAALRGEPYDIEFRLSPGGRARWVREKAELEVDERGELIGGVGMTQDITERKRFEEEQRRDKDRIRESQERFELALEGADLAAWDWNIKTGEIIFSPRWAEMRGLRPEDVRPHVDSWTSGMHPSDMVHAQKALADHFQGRTDDYRAELRVRTQSGRWLWVFGLGKVFARDEEGEPVRMVGVELDITERKRLEEELRIAEAKSSGIVSISADAIISIDRNQRITLFNEGAEKTFGYSKEEVIGGPLEILFPERFRAIHGRHVETFAAGTAGGRRMGGRGTPIFGLRKTGEEFPVDAAISKLEVGGTTILTVALRDVTEQKRVESEQRFLAEFGAVLATTLDYEETAKTVARLVVRHLGDVCIVETVEERGEVRRVVVAHRDPEKAAVTRRLQELQLDRSRSLPRLVGFRNERTAVDERRHGRRPRFDRAERRTQASVARSRPEVPRGASASGTRRSRRIHHRYPRECRPLVRARGSSPSREHGAPSRAGRRECPPVSGCPACDSDAR